MRSKISPGRDRTVVYINCPALVKHPTGSLMHAHRQFSPHEKQASNGMESKETMDRGEGGERGRMEPSSEGVPHP